MRFFFIRSTLILFLALAAAAGLEGCYTPRAASTTSNSSPYQKDVMSLNPDFVIYHNSENTSQLFFRLRSNEFQYNVLNEKPEYANRITINARLLSSYQSPQVFDSAHVLITDVESNLNRRSFIYGNVEFHAEYGKTYVLEIKVRDNYRNNEKTSFLYVDKTNGKSRQNFLVLSPRTMQPWFEDYLDEQDTVLIRHNNKEQATRLLGRFYHREFTLPPPPFVLYTPKPFHYAADSLFSLNKNTDGYFKVHLPKQGFYHFQTDSTVKEGLTLFRFSKNYPYIDKGEKLLPPLRFITTRSEYEDMNMNKNKKVAVENFWMQNAGNKDRARHAIESYYKRVQEANVFFHSYVEGWRTERGIIYIIYGKPNYIYSTPDSETWVYGEQGNFKSISFTFIKVINPFTDNDFLLNRSEIYKDDWYRFVDTWRQGRYLN